MLVRMMNASIFAGRIPALARLHTYVTDTPTTPSAFTVLGWAGSGKSSLLAQCGTAFGDLFVTVLLPLEQMPTRKTSAWLSAFAVLILGAVERRGFLTEHVPPQPINADEPMLRAWLTQDFLPRILSIIRPHRRLVLLVDDAHYWVNGIAAGDLAADLLQFVDQLLIDYPQLRLILTLDTSHEDVLPALAPLANTQDLYRLQPLSRAECAELFDDAPAVFVDGVYSATGGQVVLLNRMATLWLPTRAEPLRTLVDQTYAASVEDFRALWLTLTQEEKIVLTAISGLLYTDPLGTINAEKISVWLVETEYPLDLTAIQAAKRALEYRELLAHTPQGSLPTAGLFQRWLLEYARLDNQPHAGEAVRPAARKGLQVALVGLGVALAVVMVVLLLWSISNVPLGAPTLPIAPTVTLPPSTAAP
jgi:hypothetical protein